MNIYLKESIDTYKRLLSLIDRNPLSPTFGCFHRCFWLHKLSDFPSAIRQQGVLALAQFWRFGPIDELQSEEAFALIKASISYTCEIQNGDGSFDEWYPNERGWAGPTGYIIHSLASTYELCAHQMDSKTRESLERTLLKGALFLASGWEKHVLFNHVAMALLPIYQVFQITNDSRLKEEFNTLFKRFKSYYHFDEGWGLEYDGADVGYQSASLSFLSRLYERMGEGETKDDLKEICVSSLSFIEHFCFPDGRFSAKMGSRETDVLFPYGIEFWANAGYERAIRISNFARTSLEENILLAPKDHEDHYFIYRLPEFLATGHIAKDLKKVDHLLPFEQDFYERDFSKAGILCLKKDGFYTAINFTRGGVIARYDCSTMKASLIDRGILLKVNDNVFTSSQVSKNKVTRLSVSKFRIEGKLVKFSPKAFNTFTFLIFRLSCFFLAWNKFTAYWFKAFIRFLLLKLGSSSEYSFSRTINLESDTIIEDELEEGLKAAHLSGEFDIRYVPQSRYFHFDDLKFSPKVKSD